MCAQIGWDENVPADTESVSLGDDRIRSLKTSLRQGLDVEHFWPSAGGDAGVHRVGSARAYVGTQSQVSSSGLEGRLMFASDTSRFFHVGSGGTVYLGGPRNIEASDPPGGTAPQRHYWQEEWGVVTLDGTISSSSSIGVTIPNSGYSGLPYVFANIVSTGAPPVGRVAIGGLTSSSFYILATDSPSVYTVNWRSVGTRVL